MSYAQAPMQIHQIPALKDNYFFVLHDPVHQTAAVIDPGEAQPVLACLQTLDATLTAIFHTHHHHDHIGGDALLLSKFPEAVVYGGAEDRGRIPGQSVFLEEGDRVTFADRVAEVLFVPGHTRAHIAYYFKPLEAGQPGELFCGDTLFAGGCGRLFEGTPAQMVDSLSKIRNLPDDTRVWCAHEYTLNNLRFAVSVDRQNQALSDRLKTVETQRQRGEFTIPSQLSVEKQTNPFLRWDRPEIQAMMSTQDPIQTFARLRGKKDQW